MQHSLFKNWCIILFAISIVMPYHITAYAEPIESNNIYYVAMNGNDSTGDGTEGNPWRTIQKAADAMTAGDTALIREGTYREEITITASGTESNPITFQSYPGENATITGTDLITDWQVHDGHVYKANFGGNQNGYNEVYVDRIRMTEAKWPNNGPANNLLQPAMGEMDSGTATSIQDGDLIQPDGFWNGAKVAIKGGDGWIVQTSIVTEYKQSTGLKFGNLAYSESNYYTPRAGNKYYLFGLLDALDTEQEWHLDRDSSHLYLWLPANADPQSHTIEARVREYGLHLNGQEYIQFSGIDFFAADIEMDQADHIRFNEVDIQHLIHPVEISGSDNIIMNSKMAYSLDAVVNITGTRNSVVNNLIEYGNATGTWNAIVNMRGNQNYLGYNTIRYAGRGNIGIYGKQNLIEYNDVYYGGTITNDNGLIYGGYTDAMNTVIRYNWLHDNLADKLAEGLYPDNGSFNYIIHHNVIWNAGTALRLNTPNNYTLVYNNTLIGDTAAFGHMYKTDLYGGRFINNILIGKYDFPNDMARMNNIEGSVDPKLTSLNFQAPDFTPQSDSPAVDQGVFIEGVTESYSGTAPDIGAYEFGAAPWKPGHNFDVPRAGHYEEIATTYMNLIQDSSFEKTDPLLADTRWVKTGTGQAKAIYDYSTSNYNKRSRGGHYGAQLGNSPEKPYSAESLLAAEQSIQSASAVRDDLNASPEDIALALRDLNAKKANLEKTVPGLIADSGFEGDSIKGWNGVGLSSPLVLSTEDSHAGDQSLKAVGRTAAWAGPRIDVNVSNGKTYNFSAYVKLGAGNDSARLVLMPNGVNTPRTIGSVQANAAEWKQIGASYTVNETEELTYATIAFSSQNATADLLIDDFIIVEVTDLIQKIQQTTALLSTAPSSAAAELQVAIAAAQTVLDNKISSIAEVADAVRQLDDAAAQSVMVDAGKLTAAIDEMQALVDSARSLEDGIEQTIDDLKPNTEYRLSVWVKTEGTNDYVEFGVRSNGGIDESMEVRSQTWARNEITFSTGPNLESVTVYAYKPKSELPAFIDDFGLSVYEETRNPGVKAGGITNPGFETGDAYPWFSFGSDLMIEEGNAYEGEYYLKAYNRVSPEAGPAQYVEVYNGKLYDAGARVRLSAGTDTVQLVLSYLVGDQIHEQVIASALADSLDWIELSGEYLINENANIDSAALYLRTTSSPADLSVDRIVLKERLIETAAGTGDGESDLNAAIDDVEHWNFSAGPEGKVAGPDYLTLTNGFARYTGETYRDSLLSFNLKLVGNEASWPIINIRNQGVENYNSGYVFVIKQNVIELQRRIGGATTMIYGGGEFDPGIGGPGIANSYLTFGETAFVEAGSYNTDNGVRILLRINGETVIDYEDTLNSVRQAGYFGLNMGTAQEITIGKLLARPVAAVNPFVREDETFIVTYGLEPSVVSFGEVLALDIAVEYDGGRFDYISMSATDANTMVADSYSEAPGKLRILLVHPASDEGFRLEDAMLEFAFKAKLAGTGEIKFNETIAANGVGKESYVPAAVREVQVQSESDPDPTEPEQTDSDPTDFEQQTIDLEALISSGHEKISIKMNETTQRIFIPANAAEIMDQNILQIESENFSIELPKEVLQQLQDLSRETELTNALITFAYEYVDAAEHKELMSKANMHSNGVTVKAGKIMRFRLSVTSLDGKELKLTNFIKPIRISLLANEDLDKDLTGMYYISDDGEINYLGGRQIGRLMVADSSHFSKFAVLEYNKTYSDIKEDHWALPMIKKLSAKHIVQGVSDNEFAPDKTISRAEFAAMIVRILGLKSNGESDFMDVKADSWYSAAIHAAYEAGIINGRGPRMFAPDDAITREEMAVMIVRANKLHAIGDQGTAAPIGFQDYDQISLWAAEYVEEAVGLGFIQGYGNRTFVPKGILTRAEGAKVSSILMERGLPAG